MSNISQISIVLRYLHANEKNKPEIREDFITFIDAFASLSESGSSCLELEKRDATAELSLTGKALGSIIVKEIKSTNLNLPNCVGVGTDGCTVMLSEVGAVQEIQKQAPNALATPCYSHKLNNIIAQSSKVAAISKSVDVMKEIISFFSFPKRCLALQQYLGKKLVHLCETRWVERHDGVLQFAVDMPDIAEALDKISSWKDRTTGEKQLPYLLHCARAILLLLYCVCQIFFL